VQFEIGPASEASIGKIQASFPQQGFVDHVITPFVGSGWMLAEDALDRYVIERFEQKFQNRHLRALVRSGLNPARAFANAMALRYPWHRDNRPGVWSQPLSSYIGAKRDGRMHMPKMPKPELEGKFGVAPFEFSMGIRPVWYFGGTGACLGGGGETGFRAYKDMQMVLEVSGCKIMNMPPNVTGDGLNSKMGPRWLPRLSSRWSPFAQFLVGGLKVTEERMYPQLMEELTQAAKQRGADPPTHDQFTTRWESTKLSMSMCGGLDFRINPALAIRLANLQYKHSWVGGRGFENSFSFTTGVVVRLGTW
jgi:hypothetical protein